MEYISLLFFVFKLMSKKFVNRRNYKVMKLSSKKYKTNKINHLEK